MKHILFTHDFTHHSFVHFTHELPMSAPAVKVISPGESQDRDDEYVTAPATIMVRKASDGRISPVNEVEFRKLIFFSKIFTSKKIKKFLIIFLDHRKSVRRRPTEPGSSQIFGDRRTDRPRVDDPAFIRGLFRDRSPSGQGRK